jgi:Ca2+-binding RTX toxin-like protein
MYRKLVKNALFPGLLFISYNILAQSPGNVSGPSFWLLANNSTALEKPWSFNFNPSGIGSTTNTGVLLPGKFKSLERVSLFTVYRKITGVEEKIIWDMQGSFGDLLLTSKAVSSKTNNSKLVFADNKAAAGQAETTSTILHTYLQGKTASITTNDLLNKENQIWFGSTGIKTVSAGEEGFVPEMILYERILNEEEISKVETYLCLKYGITLEKDYINSNGEKVWNREINKLFSNNIAGIGKDAQSMLNQKQSVSCNINGQLIIGAKKIAAFNSDNTACINDHDYLIWGDNAGKLILQQQKSDQDMIIFLLDRKWLMQASGISSGKMATQLQIDTKSMDFGSLPKENFCLIIDRSGKGDFEAANCTSIHSENFSAGGIASFNDVLWDTDGSGKDVFTFGFKKNLPAGDFVENKTPEKDNPENPVFFCNVFPNPVTNGKYQMELRLKKPAGIQVKIYDQYQHLLDLKKGSNRSHYLINGVLNAPPGSYIIKIETGGFEYYRTLILQ